MKDKIIVKQLKKRINEMKQKSDLALDTVTSKVFDMNLLTAIKTDFSNIIDKMNTIIISETYLFKILEKICIKANIEISQDIKDFFILK